MTYPSITFAMTAGRRLPLLIRSMHSFLANCEDQDLIDNWVISLDRAPASELREIANRWPFLTITQSPRPGQAANLNWLYWASRLVETEWVLHWEDDWDTIQAGHFVRLALDVARSDPRIRNVVFRGWEGVTVFDGELEYRTHVFWPGGSKERMLTLDSEWYGYSLNPSLQHLPTIHTLGEYDERPTTRYFDRPQAMAYRFEHGLIRANPTTKYVEHIGEERPAWGMK